MTKPNPFSLPEPWSLVSSGYTETTMHYLGQFSSRVLDSISFDTSSRVADIACGPGTVSRMLHSKVNRVDALDFSQDMIRILESHISENGISNIFPTVGDGQSLPFTNNYYDLAISMFGLMFFPDRAKGFSEAYRILKPGGCIAVASWTPVTDSPLMELMFGAIRAINPDLPSSSSAIENLENPKVFERELKFAGFRDVSVQKMTESMTVRSAESFWDDMEAGSAPIVMMKHRAEPGTWAKKRKIAVDFIQERILEFPNSLSSSAWIGTGIK